MEGEVWVLKLVSGCQFLVTGIRKLATGNKDIDYFKGTINNTSITIYC